MAIGRGPALFSLVNDRARLLLIAVVGLLTAVAQAERVEFRSPRWVTYQLETNAPAALRVAPRWFPARRVDTGRQVEFGRRVVVQCGSNIPPLFRRLVPGLRIERRADERTWVLGAASPQEAIRAAELLSQTPGIESAAPTTRRRVRPHFSLAPSPNDPYFLRQYSLSTDDPDSSFLPVAADLNLREAWCYAHGEGVIVGVGDDGIEGTHPDLAANFAGPNYNFLTDTPGGDPADRTLFHGTAVAGLIAAVGDNHLGLSGVAPKAKLASWVIFDQTDTNEPDDAGFAAMFGTANQAVGVQNHSWGNADTSFVQVSLLENLAVEKAVTEGRAGRGVVIVRSAGNTRQSFVGAPVGDANLDGYANDPRQIAVAAVRTDGRVTSYSTPGSCVLVAAPGGDYRGGYPGLITTDRTGFDGLNAVRDPLDPTSFDYLVGSRLFVGTSAAAPLVSGLAALIVSARPELHWFEVQQIIALAARHVNLTDGEIQANGAGLRVSPNVGFGVPDAGVALRLALGWRLQPLPQEVRSVLAGPRVIPDQTPEGTLSPLGLEFPIDQALVVQHVRLKVLWSHPSGQELRVDLISPAGTRSSLLRTGTADEPVPDEWTFSSAGHLGETSRGVWKAEFTDTRSGQSGQVGEVTLILDGRPTADSDNDGLDDDWESQWFGSLDGDPRDDPDGDGWNNAAEQMAGRDPTRPDEDFSVSLGTLDSQRLRLSWPSNAGQQFEVWGARSIGGPFTLLTNVPSRFPESGWMLPPLSDSQVFTVRRVP